MHKNHLHFQHFDAEFQEFWSNFTEILENLRIEMERDFEKILTEIINFFDEISVQKH